MSLKEKTKLAEIQDGRSENVEVTLTLQGDTKHIQWNKQIPLLDALLNEGIEAPYSCCRGTCGTCVCKLEEGEVRLKRNFVLSEAHIQQGLILACVSVPVSDRIKINYDEF
ncbi:Ferredoxin [Sinomicrobium oceani]|uniref:Ferredoxin n=1 Tax=Sinomicrobium oceani TaxID=1150368 RepID=A0A1K1PT62_9FLAO|nr:2Fe-2S iron-sulfur cluster binding domain-containing protein [Sinomicrobium oceani]SFW50692.1 Ferredoxin [Sinomicrobium oceani]